MPESHPQLLEFLQSRFPGRVAINRNEFRELLDLSHSTDARLKREGAYPPMLLFTVPGTRRQAGKILLTELAGWLARMQIQSLAPAEAKPYTGKKRGRPVGSKNKQAAKISDNLGF